MEVVALSESLQYWQLGGLPRELWMVILERLFESTENRPSFFRLCCLVSSWWSKMVYESVSVLDFRICKGRFACLTDNALERLVSLQVLRIPTYYWVSIASLTITDAGLRTATNLTRLDITGAKSISDDGVAGLTKLRWLNPNEGITDIGMKNLTNLTTLYVKPSISDVTIGKLTKLTTLVVWDSHLTPGGLKLLTNLTRLSISSLRYNYDDAIIQMANLAHLRIGGYENYSVSDDGLQGMLNLTHLDLSDNFSISDIGIRNLTKLETLSLFNNAAEKCVTDDGLSNLVNLTDLDLTGCLSITDAGITGLTKLSSLILGRKSNVTDHGISNLVNLTLLSLNDANSDAGISMLTNLTCIYRGDNQLVTESCLRALTKLVAM